MRDGIELKNTVTDTECQFLFLTAGMDKHDDLTTIEMICSVLELPLLVCQSEIVDSKTLHDVETDLLPSAGHASRQRLLVVGRYLEEQINVIALHGLYLGFEVFLLKDFIIPRNIHHVEVYDSRLVQAGAVLSTLRQLLYEWISSEERVERRSRMIQLLASINEQI